MQCPACAADFVATVDIAGLTICPSCTASLVLATGQRATGAETALLTPCTCPPGTLSGKCQCGSQLTALRKARAQARKAMAGA